MTKIDAEICKTYPRLQTDSGRTVAGLLFIFVDHGAGIRRATYLYLDCAKNVDKNWNITVAFIIHVNFVHAWAKHYPVTLILILVQRCLILNFNDGGFDSGMKDT